MQPFRGLAEAELARHGTVAVVDAREVDRPDGTIDLYLHLRIKGSSLLAFDTVDPVIEQGYTSAMEQLDEQIPRSGSATTGLSSE